MEVNFPAFLENYDRRTGQPNDEGFGSDGFDFKKLKDDIIIHYDIVLNWTEWMDICILMRPVNKVYDLCSGTVFKSSNSS